MSEIVNTIAKQIKLGRWKDKGYRGVQVDDITLRLVKLSKNFKKPALAVDIKYDEAADYYRLAFYEGTNVVKRLADVGEDNLNDILVDFFYGNHGARRASMLEWLNMQMPTVYRRSG